MSNKDSGEATSESTMLKGALVPTIIVGIACVALFSVLEGVHGFYGALVAVTLLIVTVIFSRGKSKMYQESKPESEGAHVE